MVDACQAFSPSDEAPGPSRDLIQPDLLREHEAGSLMLTDISNVDAAAVSVGSSNLSVAKLLCSEWQRCTKSLRTEPFLSGVENC